MKLKLIKITQKDEEKKWEINRMRTNVEKTIHAKLKLNDKLKKIKTFLKKNKNKKNQDQILKLKILRGSFENLKRQVRKK